MPDPKDPSVPLDLKKMLEGGATNALSTVPILKKQPTPTEGQVEVKVGFNATHVLLQFGEDKAIAIPPSAANGIANMIVTAAGRVMGKELKMRIVGDE